MIGIDFDNTIVCYDPVFFRAACDRGLIPRDFPPFKEQIRDRLREQGKEADWTELQAYVYGEYIADADPFPGVREFLERCRDRAVQVSIISHKTERPYRGPDLDLRRAAREWLRAQQLTDSPRTGLSSKHVYFEESKEDKLRRIELAGCRLFIDDLPEFLEEPGFPVRVQKVLFDPVGRDRIPGDAVRCGSWAEITRLVLEGFAK